MADKRCDLMAVEAKLPDCDIEVWADNVDQYGKMILEVEGVTDARVIRRRRQDDAGVCLGVRVDARYNVGEVIADIKRAIRHGVDQ